MGIFRAAFVSFNDLRSNLLPVKDNRCNKAKSRFSVDRNFLIPPRRPKKSTFASRLLSRSTHRRIAGRALIEPCYGPTSLPSGTTFEPGVASRDASFSSAVCREKSSSLTTSSRSSISLIVIGRVFFPIMANFNLCDECSAVPWRTYHCSLLFDGKLVGKLADDTPPNIKRKIIGADLRKRRTNIERVQVDIQRSVRCGEEGMWLYSGRDAEDYRHFFAKRITLTRRGYSG
jgi:hypothetical protein